MINDKGWRTLLPLILLVIVMSASLLTGCGPAPGFKVYASSVYGGVDNGGDASVSVGGSVQGTITIPNGAPQFGYLAWGGECYGQCTALTGADGIYSATDVQLPADWLVVRGGDPRWPDVCSAGNGSVLHSGDVIPLPCQFASPFDFFPDPLDLSLSPPSEFTITVPSGTISCQYGMPQVSFYSDYGEAMGSTTAYWVSDDWSTLNASFPWQMTSAYSGNYGALIQIVGPDGGLKATNGGTFQVIGNDPPPPPPPDPPPPDPCDPVCNIDP